MIEEELLGQVIRIKDASKKLGDLTADALRLNLDIDDITNEKVEEIAQFIEKNDEIIGGIEILGGIAACKGFCMLPNKGKAIVGAGVAGGILHVCNQKGKQIKKFNKKKTHNKTIYNTTSVTNICYC